MERERERKRERRRGLGYRKRRGNKRGRRRKEEETRQKEVNEGEEGKEEGEKEWERVTERGGLWGILRAVGTFRLAKKDVSRENKRRNEKESKTCWQNRGVGWGGEYSIQWAPATVHM